MSNGDGVGESQRLFDLLWGARSESRRGPKPSLTAEQIVAAAAAIADTEGLEAVSMQRVAQACGVTTMALYRYVPGKTELVALMLDIGLGAPPALNGATGDWRAQLEDWARKLWTVFTQHPWSLAATAFPRVIGPNEIRWFEVAIAALAATPLHADDAMQAVMAILLYVRGMAAASPNTADRTEKATSGSWGATIAQVLRNHSAEYPSLAAAQQAGAFVSPAEDRIGFGLRLLFDGISVRIADLFCERSV